MSGWPLRKLEDVCEIIAGQSPPGSSYNADQVGLPFYQGKKEFGVREVGPPTTWTSATTKIAKAGDILMSVRAPVGPVNFLRETACIGRGLAAIRAGEKIDPDFLFYNLLMREPEISGTEGAVFASINRSEIAALEIPLPPLEEQRRIVAALDEAFAAIATAIANAEKNLANARELLIGIVTEALGDESLPSMPLDEVAEVIMGQSPPGSTYNSVGTGTPLINGPDEFGGKDPFAQTLAIKFTTNPTKFCRKGDALVCVRGSTTGRMNLAGQDACIGRGVAAVRSINEQGWINHYLRFNQDVIYRLGSGATFPNVSSSQLKKLMVPMPTQAERKRLLTKLEVADALTTRLIDGASQKLALLGHLKQSLLHRAFSGELTEREPLAA